MPCLEPNQLFDFANGIAPAEARAAIEAHLDSCASCRTVVAEAMRTSSTGARLESTVTPGTAGIASDLPAGTRVERFAILERAGAGAMGVVYAAYDPILDRRCALKLLLGGVHGPDLEEQRGRLLREARALARLNHPNVVAVHEVLSWNDQIAVAMEYVDGVTLSQWLREAERPMAQVLDVMLQAGRGLAAAHAAGVIHRDFKPDNVLLGHDGRARVSDFGLARPEVRPPLSALPEAQAHSLDVLSRPFVGTPAYMAPEQIERGSADERSDQFSFCVTLFEVLYKTRPFTGTSLAQMLQSQKEGRLPLPPGGFRAPRRLQQVLGRGLAPNPEDRYPSMQALVHALAAAAHRRTRETLAAAAGVALLAVAAAGGWLWHRHQGQLCAGGTAEVARVWGDSQRAAVTRALEASGLPFAKPAGIETLRVLDAYAQAWAGMHREACEATRLRGAQSDEVLGLRMACLGQRLRELGGVATALAAADAKLASRSVKTANALSPLSGCSDLEVLKARVKPPADPVTRGRVDELRTQLVDAKVLLNSGRYTQGLELATRVAADANTLGYRPLAAQALWLQGSFQEETGDAKSGAQSMNDAVLAAEAGGDAKLAASAWSDLVFLFGMDLGKPEQAIAASRHAASEIEALGGDDELEARRLYGLGATYYAQGKYGDALEAEQKALALRERLVPANPQLVQTSLNGLAAVEMRMGDATAALATQRRALSLVETLYGKDHPEDAVILNNMAGSLSLLGKYDEALAVNQRVLEIREKTLGPNHPDVCLSVGAVGQSLNLLKRNEEAEGYLRRALDLCSKAFGDADPRLALTLNHLGAVLYDQKKYSEALPLYERSLAIREKSLGPEHPDLVFALDEIGNTLVAQHKQKQAVPYFERALHLCDRPDANRRTAATVRMNLGVALWEGAVDKRRARQLVAQARDTFVATAHDGSPRELDNADKWLREHPSGRTH
jgi:tetratricopeptide (TPR) repeat protein/tRNA A-37 threonylcarbamoyl transferase component Bud32